MGIRRRAVLGLTAAGVFASALVPTAAEARAGAQFTFCNTSGNIPNPTQEYVAFPQRGWIQSTVVSSGGCWGPVTLSGYDNEEVVGYRLVNGQWLAVYERWFSDSQLTVNVQF
jgi:hypothetical protein